MALIDDFLESVTDEFGNKIDFSNIEVDGFEGVLCFGEYCTDIYITETHSQMYNNNLNWNCLMMVEAFIRYVQFKMKESREYFENNKIK